MNSTKAGLQQLRDLGYERGREFHGPRGSGKTQRAKMEAHRLRKQGCETLILEVTDHEHHPYEVVYYRKRQVS